jgi:hypothetical protein
MKNINNLPTNYVDFDYIIVRMFDGEFWYYGADNDFERAECIANEIGGFVVIQ